TAVYYGDGAGLCSAANNTLILKDCTFTGNRIGNEEQRQSQDFYSDRSDSPVGNGNGGGLYCGTNCNLTLNNCDFAENKNGVKDYGQDKYYSSSTYLYFEDSDQLIVPGDGGGVYCGAGSHVDITNGSRVYRNESTHSGGGLYFESDCTINMDDSFVLGNDANDSGGGLRCGINSEIHINNSAFANNRAYSASGGAIYISDTTGGSEITNCAINDNRAKRGGGLCWTGGDLTVSDCMVSGNSAEGEHEAGGGFYCLGSSATIKDCVITENVAPDGFGGGGYLSGANQRPVLSNCLVTKNLAGFDGGGIYVDSACLPSIFNCTLADNAAADYGGGLFSTNYSNTTVIDSIIWGNTTDMSWPQIGLGDPCGTVAASYCDIQDDYPGTGNISGNPLFVDGYYLSHTAAGQGANSPCVDTGSDLAGNVGMDTYTTRIDGVTDVTDSNVDMGYHYRPHVFELRSSVVNSQGLVAPLRKVYPQLTEATVLALPERGYVIKQWTGTDQDASKAIFNTVTMDVDKAVTVEFVFAHKRTFTVPGLGPDGQYLEELQAAINVAEDGDVIILTRPPEGTKWPWGGFYIVDKVVMITSEDPEDPNCVAATIIDCNSAYDPYWQWTGSGGFYFGPGSGSSVLQGITITGGRGRYGHWLDDPSYYYYRGWAWDPYYGWDPALQSWSHGGGAIYISRCTSPVITDCIITDSAIYGPNGVSFGAWEWFYNGPSGGNGGGAEGGAIYIGPRSSPTIANCEITDSYVQGGHGGDGGGIGEFGWSGGRGGWPGYARGGGIYCASESTPTIIRCRIDNCQAVGGNGGDGGAGGRWGGYGGGWSASGKPDYWHYQQTGTPYASYYPYYYYWWWYYQRKTFWVNEDLWKHWGYAAGPWYYSGHGGGVYCASNSEPTFIQCTISNNYADGGLSGIGGVGVYVVREEPVLHMDIPGFGGGVYCAPASQATFTGCDIVNNTIEDHSQAFEPFDPNDPNSGYDPNDPNVVAP
ncbi:MAG: right-handed parallel beta-helix repeat-containing protein, partial [Planctomycetota bacterium]